MERAKKVAFHQRCLLYNRSTPGAGFAESGGCWQWADSKLSHTRAARVVLDFDRTETAATDPSKLRQAREEHLIDMLDAGVVICPERADTQINGLVNRTAIGVNSRLSAAELVGSLASLLMLNQPGGLPVAGRAGAAMDKLGGRISDFVSNVAFVSEHWPTIQTGTPMLVALVVRAKTN